MRTFLGLFMVVIASGDDEMINGVLEDSVLLPCSCPVRNLDKDFKWQMDEPNKSLVFKYNGGTSDFYGRYKGRGKKFLDENSKNCSVLLTNITKDDQGKYKCIFYIEDKYTSFFVNLNISEEPRQLQSTPAHTGSARNRSDSSRSTCFMRYFKTIPVVVVLGFSLMAEIFI